MSGDDVESGGRLVEHQDPRTLNKSARNEDTSRLAGGHLIQRLAPQMPRTDAFERLACRAAHLCGDVHVEQHALCREEARHHSVLTADRAGAVAGHEAAVQVA